MKKRHTLIAALCFAVLATLTWWDFTSGSVRSMSNFAERTLLGMGFEEIASFTIDNENGHFALEQRDDGWWLTEPIETMADQTWVAIILSNMADAKRHSAIDNVPAERLGEYGLDSPVVRASFHAIDGRETAIAIGRESATTNRLFATEVGTNEIFTVSGHVLGNLDKTLLQLRDKRVFREFPEGEPVAIQIVSTLSGMSHVEKDETGQWWIAGEVERPAYVSLIGDVIEDLTSLQAADYIDPSDVDLEEMGLSPPLMQVAIVTDTGASMEINIGFPLNLRAEQFYAQVPGRNDVITIPGRTIGLLPRRSIDWIDRNLFSLDPNTLDRVTLIVRQVADVGGDANVQLERDSYGIWRLSDSPGARVNQDIVAEMIRMFARLTADEISEIDPPTLVDYGLERPILSFIAHSADGDATVHIDQGASVGEGEGQAFFRRGGDTVVFIAPQVYDDANLLRIQLVNRHLVAGDITQVARIEYQREGLTLEFELEDGMWKWVDNDRPISMDRIQRAFTAMVNAEYSTLMQGEAAAAVRSGMTEPAWSLALFDAQGQRLSDLRSTSVPSLTERGDQMIVLIDGELACWVNRSVMTRVQEWIEQLVRG